MNPTAGHYVGGTASGNLPECSRLGIVAVARSIADAIASSGENPAPVAMSTVPDRSTAVQISLQLLTFASTRKSFSPIATVLD